MDSKKILCILIALFSIVNGYSQSVKNSSNAASLLNKTATEIRKGSVISFTFNSFDTGGKCNYSNTGTIITSGNKYRLSIGDELLIVSNGQTRWIYNEESEEVIISNATESETDITENPFILFDIAGNKNYSLGKAITNTTINSKATSVITIIPKDKKTYKSIQIAVNKATNTPVKISIFAANNSKYIANINSFKAPVSHSASQFVLTAKQYNNAIVTDLR